MSFSRALQAEQAISTFKEKAPRTPQEESMSLTVGQWGSGAVGSLTFTATTTPTANSTAHRARKAFLPGEI